MPWWIEPAVTFALHHKRYLIVGAAATAIIGGSYMAGWQAHSARALKDQKGEQTKVIEKITTQYVERDGKERTVYVKDLETTRRLEAERDRLRQETIRLQYELDSYVPIKEGDSNSYLSVGAVRLLNEAASGSGRSSTASFSASTSLEADLAPSGVSWLDLSKYTVRISGQYNDAAAQCNALITWVEDNYVNKPE